jgi:hypothetical protein
MTRIVTTHYRHKRAAGWTVFPPPNDENST